MFCGVDGTVLGIVCRIVDMERFYSVLRRVMRARRGSGCVGGQKS